MKGIENFVQQGMQPYEEIQKRMKQVGRRAGVVLRFAKFSAVKNVRD